MTLLSSFRFGFAALAAVLCSLCHNAYAQNYPSKPVRITTPFPVGSGPEGVLRLLADKLSKQWGQPVVVDSKPGGNGFIAVDQFKRSAQDGHELLQLDNAHLTVYPHLFKHLPYDVATDFDPIYPLFKTYFFMATAADGKYGSVQDVLADARAKPGQLNYGSWSVGNPVHLGSALLETLTHTEMQHVVYKETSQLYTAVATGELAYAFGTAATTGPLYRAGKLKYLAVAAPQRVAGFADVPTVAEAGGPKGFEVVGGTIILAPKGLAPALRQKLAKDIEQALNDPEMKAKYQAFGYEPFRLSGQSLAQYLTKESAKQAEIVKKTKAQLD